MKKTIININKPDFLFGIDTNIFTIGSCFSIEIAKYFENRGILVNSNPFGTIYNSCSIYKSFELIFANNPIDENYIYFENDLFFSPFHSTEFDAKDKNNVIEKINENIKENYEKIIKSNIFLITLGTSVVYRFKKNNEIVANCHKLKDNLFEKEILSVEENTHYLNEIIKIVKSINKNSKILFTVSPIRHNPNNLIENNYSKSILRIAVENVINNEDILYFPSYEIVLDELRDYKYYSNDKLHLKNRTVNIIMTKFGENFFSKELNDFITKFIKIKKTLLHKPFNPNSQEYFNILQKNFIDTKNLYLLRNSQILEKIQFIIFFRILKIFSLNYNLDFVYSNTADKKLLDMFESVIQLEKKEVIDLEKINYTNPFITNLERIKKRILIKHHILNNTIEKIVDWLI